MIWISASICGPGISLQDYLPICSSKGSVTQCFFSHKWFSKWCVNGTTGPVRNAKSRATSDLLNLTKQILQVILMCAQVRELLFYVNPRKKSVKFQKNNDTYKLQILYQLINLERLSFVIYCNLLAWDWMCVMPQMFN